MSGAAEGGPGAVGPRGGETSRAGRLAGRVAVVTGAGTRIGAAIAEGLGEEGADVVVHCHRSRVGAEEVARIVRGAGGRAQVVAADLSHPEGVHAVFAAADSIGGCDLLVNSAALFEARPLDEADDAHWERVMALNLTAPFRCCRQAAMSMRRKGRGDIVNILDVAGALRPWKGYAAHGAAKAGLRALTECLALELAPTIRVNAVAPGTILPPTSMSADEVERIRKRIPAQRLGSLKELVATVVFLVTGPRFITGQVLAVDGGRSLA